MSTFSGTRTDGLADIDATLVQEANRIGQDIHAETVHTSPWIDLIPKGSFPDGQGYRLQSLIYERALPTNAAQDAIGLSWGDFAASALTSGQDHSGQVSGKSSLLNDSASDFVGPLNNQLTGGSDVATSRIDWVKRLEPYQLKRATVWSPEINIEDLRFAAHRGEQLTAAFNALVEGTRYGWEERNRDEYQRVVAHTVECLTANTSVFNTTDLTGATDDRFDNGVPGTESNAFLSNAILDKVYNRLIRSGAAKGAWGVESARPVFGLICSSEASRGILTEATYRTDLQESSRVDELLEPLGVSKAYRGFYHLIDDLAPRYDTASSDAGYTNGDYKRVKPFSIDASQLILPSDAYETAEFEVAHVLHKEVMESLIPSPGVTGPNVKFDPVDYSGKFHWLNIKSVDVNPLGTVGHFLGVLASASKPLKTKFGWAILFNRKVTTPAV
mgnify:FL=1|tara:strand:+ start:1516 stop:2847 length:1332 start_codon:yes stop_codon:yes gene_type:complete